MSTQNKRSEKAQIIWNSTDSNSINPAMVGSLLYDINIEKLERDNSNAVYQTYDASYTKVAAINPTTKKMILIDIPKGNWDLMHYYTRTEVDTALATKQDKLNSFDESILIENNGNIEGNVSLFQEYFEQQECELNFTPIQIIGVYLNGVKQKPSLYTITLPKTISVTNFSSGDYIEIQYTHLKS